MTQYQSFIKIKIKYEVLVSCFHRIRRACYWDTDSFLTKHPERGWNMGQRELNYNNVSIKLYKKGNILWLKRTFIFHEIVSKQFYIASEGEGLQTLLMIEKGNDDVFWITSHINHLSLHTYLILNFIHIINNQLYSQLRTLEVFKMFGGSK